MKTRGKELREQVGKCRNLLIVHKKAIEITKTIDQLAYYNTKEYSIPVHLHKAQENARIDSLTIPIKRDLLKRKNRAH